MVRSEVWFIIFCNVRQLTDIKVIDMLHICKVLGEFCRKVFVSVSGMDSALEAMYAYVKTDENASTNRNGCRLGSINSVQQFLVIRVRSVSVASRFVYL